MILPLAYLWVTGVFSFLILFFGGAVLFCIHIPSLATVQHMKNGVLRRLHQSHTLLYTPRAIDQLLLLHLVLLMHTSHMIPIGQQQLLLVGEEFPIIDWSLLRNSSHMLMLPYEFFALSQNPLSK